jgi:hypothetical protein
MTATVIIDRGYAGSWVDAFARGCLQPNRSFAQQQHDPSEGKPPSAVVVKVERHTHFGEGI